MYRSTFVLLFFAACAPDAVLEPAIDCGDGVVQPGEWCDDGNDADDDGCTSSCTPTHVCGNGVIEAGEVCDDMNLEGGDGCSATCQDECQLGADCCGDGFLHPGEQCDDGNGEVGDGCSPGCRVERGWECYDQLGAFCQPICGDAVTVGDETCDEGRDNSDTLPDRCRSDCRAPRCGDRVVDAGEACEPSLDPLCGPDCTFPSE